ncbi:MAG: hypothetical protein COB05_01190 [Marinobacter sp.]|nr:MAG: hypothetical protein COB05_01190 [Marinobacter sp.]|tara:strand:- start:67 stop:288 length:222 start_codon:yes stop_codon:yes gene_type:complete
MTIGRCNTDSIVLAIHLAMATVACMKGMWWSEPDREWDISLPRDTEIGTSGSTEPRKPGNSEVGLDDQWGLLK